MKMINRRIFLYSLLFLTGIMVILACSGQNGSSSGLLPEQEVADQDTTGQSVIEFESMVHDFGMIVEGEMVVCYFDYTNNGDGDLVISSVETTCGCTTPDWSSEPLKPGGKQQMKVIFDARGRSGIQRKVITVRSNAANPSVELTVKAEVKSNV